MRPVGDSRTCGASAASSATRIGRRTADTSICRRTNATQRPTQRPTQPLTQPPTLRRWNCRCGRKVEDWCCSSCWSSLCGWSCSMWWSLTWSLTSSLRWCWTERCDGLRSSIACAPGTTPSAGRLCCTLRKGWRCSDVAPEMFQKSMIKNHSTFSVFFFSSNSLIENND